MAKNKPNQKTKDLLKELVECFYEEDRSVRNRQLLTYRRLKLFWEGYQRVWYDYTAHDWRIYDSQAVQESSVDQSYYDKPVNVFRAYLESIFAALSITVPPITCYPDDAEDPLDLQTAKAGDKIAELLFRHLDASLIWIHALFVGGTEGMVACYSYPKYDEKYGTYKEESYQDFEEEHEYKICPLCQTEMADQQLTTRESDEYMPDDDDIIAHDIIFNEGQEICPQCLEMVDPEYRKDKLIVTRLVGSKTKPKARVCVEMYGGLNVKTAIYAKTQLQTPYLIFMQEVHPSIAIQEFPDYHDCYMPNDNPSNAWDQYEMWARLSPQYRGTYPDEVVTVRKVWLRPAAFNTLDKDEAKYLKDKYPDGVKVSLVNDELMEACNENIDDCWTLSYNPLADYLQHEPTGLLITTLQEITNDLVSLTLQTIEHGIPQTFADPAVIDFNAYQQMEIMPGAIVPTKSIPGNKQLAAAFYEVRTASLSSEVLPFFQQVQSLAQLVSGALPSLFGGAMSGGGETASEYSMSRSQALQRLQTTWKAQTSFWKIIWSKIIPLYIKELKEDEKFVTKGEKGNFYNTFIRIAELEGKIGSIELEANENLPITWSQRKDVIMQLLQTGNPEILAMLGSPENLNIIREGIGLDDFFVPGEQDVNKQYAEIKALIVSEPIQVPVDPMMAMQAQVNGMQPPQPQEMPSVDVDPIIDNHEIEFDICRSWLISEEGQLAKIENEAGYKNVLLHAYQHFQHMQMQAPAEGAAPGEKPNPKDKEAPITEASDVQTE